jgi:hypothetical protein
MRRALVIFLYFALVASARAQFFVPAYVAGGSCTPVITNLGASSNSTTGGSAVALTTGVKVTGGSLIAVLTGEGNNQTLSTDGSLSDSIGNTYAKISAIQNGGTTGTGWGTLWYAKNAIALPSGSTITYTKQTTASVAAITVLSITCTDPAAPLDTGVTVTASALSSTPSVASGTPVQANEIFIGAMTWQDTTAASCATDSGHGFSTPFVQSKTGAAAQAEGLCGGSKINSGTSTSVFSPSITASNRWGAWIVGFKHN